jgi:nucleoside-diphosphate-sugar epimerase
MKKALVIGGAGFVGRHLIPKLMAAGYYVESVDPKYDAMRDGDNYWFFNTTFENWVHRVGSWSLVAGAANDVFNYDVIVHLGANIEDVDKRLKGGIYTYSDIQLDMVVAEFVMENPPKEAFVWPTSCAVDNPDDPYAWVKLTGERLFKCLDKQGIRTVMLRPFSGYGGDQAGSYPFPAILSRALTQENPLTVWGSGLQVRDFVHIDDLTDAFMHGIQCFPSGVPIDIGTGRGTNFMDLARKMANEVGYVPHIEALSFKAESSPRRVANTKQAAHFGWTAKITLEEGIKRAVDEAKNSGRGISGASFYPSTCVQ